MAKDLSELREAVLGRNAREVEVAADGQVREIRRDRDRAEDADQPRSTKLAPRTFGN